MALLWMCLAMDIWYFCLSKDFFLEEKDLVLPFAFKASEFLQMLVYLTDIFSCLNELNISLQGSNTNIVIANEMLAAFKAKYSQSMNNIGKGNLVLVSPLEEDFEIDQFLLSDVATAVHIPSSAVVESIWQIFLCRKFGIQPPFNKEPLSISMMYHAWRWSFERGDYWHPSRWRVPQKWLTKRWHWRILGHLKNSIPKKVLGVLVPFATIYFCETGFFSLLHVETKIENHLDV